MSENDVKPLSLFFVRYLVDVENIALDLFVAADNAGQATDLWRKWLDEDMNWGAEQGIESDCVLFISSARMLGNARALRWFTDEVAQVAGTDE